MNKDIHLLEKTFALVVATILAGFLLYLFFFIRQFKVLLADLESEIPFLTSLVFSTYYFLGMLSLLSLFGAYKITKQNNRLGWRVILMVGLIGITLFPIVTWIMYLPVLEGPHV